MLVIIFYRRMGESSSSIAALGADKMQGAVDGYTRHFFSLAHHLVTNDREHPPRTLHIKMKEVEKQQVKINKKRAREEEAVKLTMQIKQNAQVPFKRTS